MSGIIDEMMSMVGPIEDSTAAEIKSAIDAYFEKAGNAVSIELRPFLNDETGKEEGTTIVVSDKFSSHVCFDHARFFSFS